MGQLHSDEGRESCENCTCCYQHPGGDDHANLACIRLQEPFWTGNVNEVIHARTSSRELPQEFEEDSTSLGNQANDVCLKERQQFRLVVSSSEAAIAQCPDLVDSKASTITGGATIHSPETTIEYSLGFETSQSWEVERRTSLSRADLSRAGNEHYLVSTVPFEHQNFANFELFAPTVVSSSMVDIDQVNTSMPQEVTPIPASSSMVDIDQVSTSMPIQNAQEVAPIAVSSSMGVIDQVSTLMPIQNAQEVGVQANITNLQEDDATSKLPLIGNMQKPQDVNPFIGIMGERTKCRPPFETTPASEDTDGESPYKRLALEEEAKHLSNEVDNPSENTSDKETSMNPVPAILTQQEAEECNIKTSISLEMTKDGEESECVNDDEELDSDEEDFEVGDIVLLCQGVPREYCGNFAIVTEVAGYHCTVAVLDESRRYGIGECWPNKENIELDSTILRIGARVVVDGLQSARTKHMNGHLGVISKHPRQGHPNFLKKAASPDTPLLTVCVVFDDVSVKEHSALLEPRFLRSWDDVIYESTRSLSETAAKLIERNNTRRRSRLSRGSSRGSRTPSARNSVTLSACPSMTGLV